MESITIIQLSDIHFEGNEPENQGLVLNAFFKDLETTIGNDYNKDTVYCIISGDLVNKGNSQKSFNDFYDKFIERLRQYVPLNHICCVPGNHDFNRSLIENEPDKYKQIQSKEYQETEFNEFVKKDDNELSKKFIFYKEFCEKKLNKQKFNIYGYENILIPEISVFCLNSALLSFGGYENIEDSGNLKIETSELNKWIEENDGRIKILLMHHPIEALTSFAQSELKSMLRRNCIDILIMGHNHDQDVYNNYTNGNNSYIKISSPQLFSDKTDLNGYAILKFSDRKLTEIKYRQWIKRQRIFLAGQEFSGTDGGIVKFEKPNIVLSDNVSHILEKEFLKAMKSYSQTLNWRERILSTVPPNSISKETEEKLDYLHLINKPDNYQIIAVPQFGLTSYAKYLAKKAWEVKRENWLYFDCTEWKLSKIESEIDDSLSLYNIQKSDVKCLLFDNWKNSIKDSAKILEKIKRLLPDVPIIILSNYDETVVIKGLDTEESHEGFKQLYLKEINRNDIRMIVRELNDEQQPIADENTILERLCLDLSDLNIHRTPLNCLQLILAFKKDFINRPINRSNVFRHVLQLIFDNPGKLFYGSTIDEKDCSFLLGYFCEYLLRNNKDYFTEKEFLDVLSPFNDENHKIVNSLPDVLQTLKNNQIIVYYWGNLKFRFSYWIYYFAATRMLYSEEFNKYMFEQKHSAYYPEIIEFYTGTDGKRNDAVQIIINDIDLLSKKVHSKIGLRDDINPFADIKWTLSESVSKEGTTIMQLEENIQKSKLPNEIKDVIADTNYNSIKPYNQTIYNYLEEYDVKNLMELARSASRALRNSLYISPELKENLAQGIYKAWKEIIRGLLLIAPVMAKTGFAGIGGARFKLTEDFPKEYQECLKSIIINMPFNVVNWYKDDVFSDRLSSLLKKYLIEYEDPIVRHIIALLVCNCRPENWTDMIMSYIGSVHKNSYYLGDLYTNLRGIYSTHFMSNAELNQTEKLIKASWAKHNIGSKSIGINSVSKVSDKVLPERLVDDL
ncbi:MAG: metallophosphoesterase [Firmicutes bacterium]|nr:metallophosphoesterase [Bacillota bacterium]